MSKGIVGKFNDVVFGDPTAKEREEQEIKRVKEEARKHKESRENLRMSHERDMFGRYEQMEDKRMGHERKMQKKSLQSNRENTEQIVGAINELGRKVDQMYMIGDDRPAGGYKMINYQ